MSRRRAEAQTFKENVFDVLFTITEIFSLSICLINQKKEVNRRIRNLVLRYVEHRTVSEKTKVLTFPTLFVNLYY
jgi:hypothetical protein